jgi:hypothetical protein
MCSRERKGTVMRLLIDCAFGNADQTLIMDNAGEADYRALAEAVSSGDPDDILVIPARITPDGPVRDRMVYARCICAIRRETA